MAVTGRTPQAPKALSNLDPHEHPTRALLVEDSGDDALLIRGALEKAAGRPYTVHHAGNLSDALRTLAAELFDVVLADLVLPDSTGLATLVAIQEAVPDVPVVVLSALLDEDLAISAVQQGAQDYLVKDSISSGLLSRAIRYAIERKKTETQLQRHAGRAESIYRLTDAVTRAASAEEIYREALDGLSRTLGASRASILLFDADGIMRFKAWRGLSEKYRTATEGHSPWTRSTVDPTPVLVDDVQDEPSLEHLRSTILAEGIRALGFIPLVYDGHLLGKFMVYYPTPHRFTEEETRLAQTIAGHIAFAIARKRSDEQIHYQAGLLDQVQTAIIATDGEGRVVHWNRHAEKLYGYTRDEVIGRDIADLTVQPEDRELAGRIMQQVISEGSWEGEFVVQRRDGTRFPAYVVDTPITGPDGRPAGMVGASVDISERHAAEEEKTRLLEQVESQRRRLEGIIENVPGIVWEAWGKPGDSAQHTDFVSNYAETMLGYSVEEWLREPNFWTRITHPDDLEKVVRTSTAHYESGGGQNRFRLTARDGRTVWVEASATVIKNESGEPVGLRGVTMDITERVKLERQVREQARALKTEYERLATLVANVDIALVLLDDHGRVVLANDCWVTRSGLAREAILGRRYDELSDDPLTQQAQDMVDRVLVDGEPIMARDLFYRDAAHPEGIFLDASLVPIRGDNGEITGAMSVSIDVTEKALAQRSAEAQRALLETVVEAIPIGILYLDRQARVVNMNSAYARMSHLDRDRAVGASIYKLLPGARTRAKVFSRVLGGESVDLKSIDFRDPIEKRVRYYDIFYRPMRDGEGQVTGIVGAFVDVTERLELDRQKDEFLSLASHELRTPITAIKGFAELALRDSYHLGDAKLTRALTVIKDKSDLLTRIIRDLIEVSRIEAGVLPMEPQEFDMRDLAREAVRSLEMTSPGAALDLHLPADPVVVRADRHLIEEVLSNLLENAVKYSHESTAVGVQVVPTDGEVQIVVRDSGMGIPADQQEKIFDRFYRASNAGTRAHNGLGLGLFIVKNIVERHDGRIWVESALHEGSSFYFTLPLIEG